MGGTVLTKYKLNSVEGEEEEATRSNKEPSVKQSLQHWARGEVGVWKGSILRNKVLKTSHLDKN